MHSKFSLALFVAGLLVLPDVASAIPLLTDLFFPPVCVVPPTPNLTRIDAQTLANIVRPFLPPFKNGTAKMSPFRPRGLNFTFRPEVLRFQDAHLEPFLSIAPQSALLFLRQELLNVSRMSYPYSTMGKVLINNAGIQSSCSGTAVGPNLVLTANHCVPWNKPAGTWSLEFVPGFDADDAKLPRPWGSAFAKQCLGISPVLIDGHDYAVCQLDSSIGIKVGYLGWEASVNDGFYLNGSWASVGYPYNFKNGNVPTFQDSITIQQVQDTGDTGRALLSQPYVDQGWSGGPLFGWDGEDPFVAGVVTATIANSSYDHIFAEATFHAGGTRLAELIQFGLTQWHP